MIVPDINLLIYAYDTDARLHSEAKRWWEARLSGRETVGLAWVVVLGFIRIITNPRVFENPAPVPDAIRYVRSWLERPNVQLLNTGARHLDVFFGHLEQLGTAGNLTTDAYLAALAQEYQAVLHTADLDFQRFAGLRWTNPIE
jgi:toxin-antitoxin system PIN domain toxin